MKQLVKIYTLLLLAVSAASCEGFLEKYPDTAMPLEINTLADAVQADYGIYSCFKSADLYSGTLVLAQDLQSDLAYAFEGYRNTYGNYYRWVLKSTDRQLQSVYGDLYMAVSRANFLLDNADKVMSTLKTEDDIEQLKKCMGDAHFARALCFSELLRVFCKAYPANEEDAKNTALYPGISLALTFDDSVIPLRSSMYDSYQQVLRDLEKAEEYLELRSYAADNPYFTTGTVHALYARVYLHMRDWAKAAEHAGKVIDSKVYSLMDINRTTLIAGYNDYRYMWLYDAGDEIIWKIPFTPTDRGGALGMIFLNYDYVSAYQPDYAVCQWVEDIYEGNDMRYDAFFQQGDTHYGIKAHLFRKYAGNPNMDNTLGRYYYTNSPKPFRLAEQYLIRAEASYRLGNEKQANEDLSALRQKRYLAYGISAASGDKLFEEIKKERVRELIMEGFRLSDLKRWGMGFTRKPQKGTYSGPDRLSVEADDPLFVWPIPQHELDAVPGLQGNESNK